MFGSGGGGGGGSSSSGSIWGFFVNLYQQVVQAVVTYAHNNPTYVNTVQNVIFGSTTGSTGTSQGAGNANSGPQQPSYNYDAYWIAKQREIQRRNAVKAQQQTGTGSYSAQPGIYRPGFFPIGYKPKGNELPEGTELGGQPPYPTTGVGEDGEAVLTWRSYSSSLLVPNYVPLYGGQHIVVNVLETTVDLHFNDGQSGWLPTGTVSASNRFFGMNMSYTFSKIPRVGYWTGVADMGGIERGTTTMVASGTVLSYDERPCTWDVGPVSTKVPDDRGSAIGPINCAKRQEEPQTVPAIMPYRMTAAEQQRFMMKNNGTASGIPASAPQAGGNQDGTNIQVPGPDLPQQPIHVPGNDLGPPPIGDLVNTAVTVDAVLEIIEMLLLLAV
jgi:hypothetical protein